MSCGVGGAGGRPILETLRTSAPPRLIAGAGWKCGVEGETEPGSTRAFQPATAQPLTFPVSEQRFSPVPLWPGVPSRH